VNDDLNRDTCASFFWPCARHDVIRTTTSSQTLSTTLKFLISFTLLYFITKPNTMADIANRAREVAKEDAERIKVLAQDAIQSRAYLYPIKV
jgi:hypothetical protein